MVKQLDIAEIFTELTTYKKEVFLRFLGIKWGTSLSIYNKCVILPFRYGGISCKATTEQ